MKVEIPRMRLGRGQNDRESWQARLRRVNSEKQSAAWSLVGKTKPALPCTVTITRIAPGNGLDDDNLSGACKAVRDAVAAWLGVDDKRREFVAYAYAQERGPWAVRIEAAA